MSDRAEPREWGDLSPVGAARGTPAPGHHSGLRSPRSIVWACLLAAGLRDVAVWSDLGNGWCVPDEHIPAVHALAATAGCIITLRPRRAAKSDPATEG